MGIRDLLYIRPRHDRTLNIRRPIIVTIRLMVTTMRELDGVELHTNAVWQQTVLFEDYDLKSDGAIYYVVLIGDPKTEIEVICSGEMTYTTQGGLDNIKCVCGPTDDCRGVCMGFLYETNPQ